VAASGHGSRSDRHGFFKGGVHPLAFSAVFVVAMPLSFCFQTISVN